MKPPRTIVDLSTLPGRRKAAIIVQMCLSEGVKPPVDLLPEELQVELTRELGHLSLVDRQTLLTVAEEFANDLEGVGLAPPTGLDAALAAMGSHLSPAALSRLRVEAARARPGAITYASAPSIPALAMVAFQREAGIELTHVPYRNPFASLPDIAQGRVGQSGELDAGDPAGRRGGRGDDRAAAGKDVPDVAIAGHAGASRPRVSRGVGLTRRGCRAAWVSRGVGVARPLASVSRAAPSGKPPRRAADCHLRNRYPTPRTVSI